MRGDIGTLEPGAHADLVALRGDPLTGIGFLADPAHVVGVPRAARSCPRSGGRHSPHDTRGPRSPISCAARAFEKPLRSLRSVGV
ncbi:hypothetical protein ACIQM3_03570 [Streptomyces sp. NPDC091271]|uniref:hypothetical protein n=1 Tax=Streptomyces sp. NPDC091271 TaxID=3365980 RepID=UPI003812CC6D